MNKLILIIVITPLYCIGQTYNDPEIYSNIINYQLNEWKVDENYFETIVISDNLTTFSKDINLSDYFSLDDTSVVLSLLNHSYQLYLLLKNTEFKELLAEFNSNYLLPIDLSLNHFTKDGKIIILKHEWIERIFKSKNIDKSWDKYYRKFPKTQGYFEFSKICYSENFAIVYFVHRAKPLIGKGSLIIIKKDDTTWNIYDKINLWYN